MLAKVIIENGQKKIQALTADTGTGAPVGSYLYLEKKSNPQGYLYCDGSTFDETVYPALYQYLGTNVLPDWREFSAVGAEQNTTSSIIATHDVFTQGQEKDDQLQDYFSGGGLPTYFGGEASVAGLQSGSSNYYVGNQRRELLATRRGNVTRGKSRAVFIYIKATSGLTENQQENVLNTINENLSYSTEEHPTGKKWIDGKPIYSRAFDISLGSSVDNTIITSQLTSSNIIPTRMDGIIRNANDGNYLTNGYGNGVSLGLASNGLYISSGYYFNRAIVIIEYIKP